MTLASLAERIEQTDATLDKVASMLEKLATGGDTPAPKRQAKTVPAKRAAAAKHIGRQSPFSAGAVSRLGLPHRVGETFVYQGKRGRSTWQVIESNANGSILAERVK
jgi:hypothetical protein